MAPLSSSVEANNRAAFLVQLNALLTQVSMTINSTSLSSANKAKLADVRAAVECWVKETGNLGEPKPSIITPVNGTAAAPAAAAAADSRVASPASPMTPASPASAASPTSVASPASPASPASADPKATATASAAAEAPPSIAADSHASASNSEGGSATEPAADAMPPDTPQPRTSSASLAASTASPLTPAASAAAYTSAAAAAGEQGADGTPAHVSACFFGETNITDLTGLMQLLFTSGLPESQRLRALARSIARLVSVRCASTIMAALQHVLHLTYGAGALPLPASDAEAMAELHDAFVQLSCDTRLSTKALIGCLELLTQNTDMTDAASVRLPTQLCVDALRQVRRTLAFFQRRVVREEYALAAAHWQGGEAADAGAASPAPVAYDEAGELSTAAESYAAQRVSALCALWGPSLSRSIALIGAVVPPAVSFLCTVAAVKEVGAPPELGALKLDVQTDLFSLCDTLPPAKAAHAGRTSSAASREAAAATDADGGEDDPSSTARLAASGSTPRPDDDSAAARGTAFASSPRHALCVASASTIFLRLGCSYQAEYLVAIAQRCGDEDDGRLVATRILTDALRHVSVADPGLLRNVVANELWRKRLLDGVLNCLVSLQPAVLEAGLDDLRVIVCTCRGALGEEIGMLYTSCLFRLLESENSHHYVKRQILLHLLTTFLSTPSGETGASTALLAQPTLPDAAREGAADDDQAARESVKQTPAPLLFHLYKAYDLNVHAHQFNLVQQFITSLSRIVRQAPRSEFALDATAQKTLQLQEQKEQEKADGAGDGTHSPRPPSTLDALTVQQSLPSIALHGLVLTVEAMVRQAPAEDDSGRDTLALLPTLDSRAKKVEEQRAVDVFNTSPRKAVQKLFAVSAEEMNPPGSEEFLKACEHSELPAPATPEVKSKIDRVATFLLSISSLSPESVAEFLSTPAVFSLQVCDVYMSRLALAGRTVVEAVKELLATVQLPKEGQKIERMLEFFCAAYYRANNVPGIDRVTVFPFANEQACLLLVVSLVMLNTALHNPKAGQQMTPLTFRRQLQKCNDEKNFDDAFLDEIFTSISRQPLTEVKAVGAATVGSSNHNSTAAAAAAATESYRGFDSLFISAEERRRLAFGLERHRLLSETRYLVDRRYRLKPGAATAPWTWWAAAARDLFLCSWSHVCAVFGPAMYEGDSPPEGVLIKCIRGLQALMCLGASFAEPTECEVTMLALLRMRSYDSVRDACISAVLTVASTAYAVHLSPRCWYSVFGLLIDLRKKNSAMLPQAENVLARMESFTRLSCEAFDDPSSASFATADEAASAAPSAEAVSGESANASAASPQSSTHETPVVAVRRVLEGVMDLIKDVPASDPVTLSAGMYFLKRCLGYSMITHTARSTEVTHYVDVRSFRRVVLPRLVSLVGLHASSDEALNVLMGLAVDVLSATWTSYSFKRYVLELPSIGLLGSGGVAGTAATADGANGSGMQVVTVDTAPLELVECFEFFSLCYEVTGSGEDRASSALVRIHLLQCVKALMSRTLRGVEIGQSCQLSLYTIISAWRRIVYPLARALSERESVGTEVSGLAGLVLRKLVALSCGSGGGAAGASLVPSRMRAALLTLLADVSYIGCMCGDVDNAQMCLSHLSALCTAALTLQSVGGTPTAAASPDVPAPAQFLRRNSSPLANQPNRLVHRMIACIERDSSFAATHALERLSLLLRCEREQTRAEAVESLRTLSLQLQPPQVRQLAQLLSEVVLEGTLGHAVTHCEVPLSDPSLVSFWVCLLDVPPTMKRCSRNAFRATLPGVLGFMANELLSVLSPAELADVATLMMSRALVSVVVSPLVANFQTKALAARCITQCAMLCLSRGAQEMVGATTGTSPLTCALRCASMILSVIQLPSNALVPPDADFVGNQWLGSGGNAAEAEEAAYSEAVDVALDALGMWGAQQIAGNTRLATLSGAGATSGASSSAVRSRTQAPLSDAAAASEQRRQRVSDETVAGGVVSDELLVEFCNFLVQILPGLPKMLHAAGPTVCDGDAAAICAWRAEMTRPAAAGWSPPPAPPSVTLRGLRGAARTLFAALWRVTHPTEMNYYAQQQQQARTDTAGASTTAGSGSRSVMAPSSLKSSVALLPHAAIRGVLNSYVELALRTTAYPSESLLVVAVDVLGGMSTLQTSTQPQQQQQQQAAVEAAAMLRQTPQEQQHIRTCTVGMYQELAIVLAYWVKLFTQPAAMLEDGAAKDKETADRLAERAEALRLIALSPQLFSALVALLTPSAGPVIVTVRDYFAWFIVQKQLAPASSLNSCRGSAANSPTRSASLAGGSAAAHLGAVPSDGAPPLPLALVTPSCTAESSAVAPPNGSASSSATETREDAAQADTAKENNSLSRSSLASADGAGASDTHTGSAALHKNGMGSAVDLSAQVAAEEDLLL